jgi:type I restriction enzyme S subunit
VKSGELRESVIFQTEETITEEALKKSSAKLVPKGAILVAMYGATVGRLARLGVEAATNQAICNIRPDPTIAHTQYIYRALEAKVPELIAQASGGAQPNISQEKVRKIRVRLSTNRSGLRRS